LTYLNFEVEVMVVRWWWQVMGVLVTT